MSLVEAPSFIQTSGDGVKEYVDGVVNIAKQEITAAKNAAVEGVENAGSTAVEDVESAKNSAMETISAAAEEINNIKKQTEGETEEEEREEN